MAAMWRQTRAGRLAHRIQQRLPERVLYGRPKVYAVAVRQSIELAADHGASRKLLWACVHRSQLLWVDDEPLEGAAGWYADWAIRWRRPLNIAAMREERSEPRRVLAFTRPDALWPAELVQRADTAHAYEGMRVAGM